jgi:nitronate monooxygenase
MRHACAEEPATGAAGVAIRTAVTEAFGPEYPIVSAPTGWVAGGRLAAAVSNAGGPGLVRAEASRPWGVGPITRSAPPESVELALSFRPAA